MLLSACSMARDQEETSTSQARCKKGPSRESSYASSIISSLSMDEVRSYFHIPEDIDFELSEGPAESTIGEKYNAVFFTLENSQSGFASPCRPWSSNSYTSPNHHLPIFTQTSFKFYLDVAY